MSAALSRHSWVMGLAGLLVAFAILTRAIQPGYGASDFVSLCQSVLPYAFAVAAQAVVVIAGGIDLSVAAMMAVTSVTAARMMGGASEESAILVVPLVLLLGTFLGALNGLFIVLSRVPDIVVTLATLFVFQGVALLILPTPGGGVASWLQGLMNGAVVLPGVPAAATAWLPSALVLLVVALGAVWWPLRRSRLGLSIYAIGSDELAAWRSGVNVARTRIAAYALAGLFCAMGGLALTMTTGNGAPIPGPYLMASVAAAVLGGCVLGGGRGGLLGPIVAVFILRLLRTDLTLLAVDPNVTGIVEGLIMIGVVMLGGWLAIRGRAR